MKKAKGTLAVEPCAKQQLGSQIRHRKQLVCIGTRHFKQADDNFVTEITIQADGLVMFCGSACPCTQTGQHNRIFPEF